jgi:sulfane dehydrogenase subunit SoxC
MDTSEKAAKLKPSSRRRFLRQGAALAGLAAVGGIRSVRGEAPKPWSRVPEETTASVAYGLPSHFETTRREANPSQYPQMIVGLTPHQNLSGIITPSGLHFYNIRNHDFPPAIDPRTHRLLIHGMVDRPLVFTIEDLKRLPSVSEVHFLECAGDTSLPGGLHNGFQTVQQSHGKLSCSLWTGVPIATLLREAGVQKGGVWVTAESADAGKHRKCLPMDMVMDGGLVAYAQNGEAVRPEQGYPLRYIVPGSVGIYNVKYVRRIKVTDQPYVSTAEYFQYRKQLGGKALWNVYQISMKSVITRPSGGQQLPGPGFYEISGLAWSGNGVIRRVEVSTDGGRSWKDAKLHDPILRKACTYFTFPWVWDGQAADLQSRCTDETGERQPSFAEFSETWGGSADYFKINTTIPGMMNNAIQPWRVGTDGSVTNAQLA